MGVAEHRMELSKNSLDEIQERIDLLVKMSPNDSYIIYMNEHGVISRLQESRRFPFAIKVGDRIEQDHIKSTNTAK